MGIIYQVQNKKIISKIKNLFQNKVLKEFGQYLEIKYLILFIYGDSFYYYFIFFI